MTSAGVFSSSSSGVLGLHKIMTPIMHPACQHAHIQAHIQAHRHVCSLTCLQFDCNSCLWR